MKEIASTIISSLESLFLQFNFRRLLFWIFLFSCIGLSLSIFENYTGYFYFSKIEKKIVMLNSLNELSKEKISKNSELYPIYKDLVINIQSYPIEPSSIAKSILPEQQITEKVLKFISGALLGIILLIMGILDGIAGKKDWQDNVSGGLVTAIVFGLFSIIIPTVYSIWINIVVFPLIQIAVLLGIFTLGLRKFIKKRK
jgi:hypothetical protein